MTRCTICDHPDRARIELGLTYGASALTLARRFECSEDAIKRHRRNHLTPQMRAAILLAVKPSEIDLEALQRSEAEGLLAQLITQRARLAQLSDLAMTVGDIKGAASIEARVTANLDLCARLLGQLTVRHEVRSTSFLVSADYLTLRHAITAALEPFPDAARAVAAALLKLETSTAEDIERRGKPLLVTAETLE